MLVEESEITAGMGKLLSDSKDTGTAGLGRRRTSACQALDDGGSNMVVCLPGVSQGC